jgi:hypothetical protein
MNTRFVWSNMIVLALVVLAAPSQAASPTSGSGLLATSPGDLVIPVARGGGAAPHSPAWTACHHIRNRHQRHLCEQQHMHG